MQNNTPPHREDSRPELLFLPALAVGVGLVIGLVVFVIVWHVPDIRTGATTFVLSVPKPLWFLIVLLVLLVAGWGWWSLIQPYDTAEEEPEEQQAKHARRPPQRPAEHRTAALLHQGPMPFSGVIHPTTPIPRAVPDIERVLHQPQVIDQKSPSAPLVPLVPCQETRLLPVKPETLISITLLGEVTVTIHLPGGRGSRRVLINAGNKRVQLLAYLAVRGNELVHRSKILYSIFAWRREDGTADDEAMGEHFHSHAKLLRGNIKEAVLKINEEAGEQLIDPDVDILTVNNEHWGISPICEVVDIAEVERQYKIIELARKDGFLADEIPPFVKEACERLIAAYPGDFIADLIKKSPKDFKPWEGKASWAKRYTTHFRGCYLAAIWLLGVFEEQQAQQCVALSDTILKEGATRPEIRDRLSQLLGSDVVAAIEQRGDEATRAELLLEALECQQRIFYGRAIEPFRSYALQACVTPYYTGSPFDEKVSYNTSTKRFGDRITASEQALRRCLKACAYTENTREANEIYSTYEAQMTSLFRTWGGLVWVPSQETLDEWESVRALTSSHRFSSQIATRQAG